MIPLVGELEGFYRLKADRYRPISHYSTISAVHALSIERRALVYEIFGAEPARRFIDPEA